MNAYTYAHMYTQHRGITETNFVSPACHRLPVTRELGTVALKDICWGVWEIKRPSQRQETIRCGQASACSQQDSSASSRLTHKDKLRRPQRDPDTWGELCTELEVTVRGQGGQGALVKDNRVWVMIHIVTPLDRGASDAQGNAGYRSLSEAIIISPFVSRWRQE